MARLALKSSTKLFQEETFIIQYSTLSLVNESSDYLNHSQFAEFLNERGFKNDRAKVRKFIDWRKIAAPVLKQELAYEQFHQD